MHRRGIRLMGELVPYMHGWGEFDGQSWMEIMDLADDYSLLCCYHTPFAFAMGPMLSAHPNVTFVAAHPGDRERVEEHIRLMKQHDNLYLDLSGTGLFRLGVLRHLVTQVGAERILFGTDSPWMDQRHTLDLFLALPLSPEAQARILYQNALELYGLQTWIE